ncbi:hypothetical protein V6N13_043289 [Hibiscus sabdariffa]
MDVDGASRTRAWLLDNPANPGEESTHWFYEHENKCGCHICACCSLCIVPHPVSCCSSYPPACLKTKATPQDEVPILYYAVFCSHEVEFGRDMSLLCYSDSDMSIECRPGVSSRNSITATKTGPQSDIFLSPLSLSTSGRHQNPSM